MKHPTHPSFEYTGGRLCLDFANTARHLPPLRDDIGSYSDLVFWGEGAGLLGAAEGRRLRGAAAAAPGKAGAVLDRARKLRKAIYGAFSAIAAGKKPLPEEIDQLSEAGVSAGAHYRIVPMDEGYSWGVVPGSADLERLLWPVARSAAELLTSDELHTVRECALETCAWLFTDGSRNQKRRWCDMKICGNRSKARRHYRRTLQSSG